MRCASCGAYFDRPTIEYDEEYDESVDKCPYCSQDIFTEDEEEEDYE